MSSFILRGSSTLLSLLLCLLRLGERSLERDDTLFFSLVLVGLLDLLLDWLVDLLVDLMVDWVNESLLVQDTTFMLTGVWLSADWIT